MSVHFLGVLNFVLGVACNCGVRSAAWWNLIVGNAISKCSKLMFGCVQLRYQKHGIVESESWKCNSCMFKNMFLVSCQDVMAKSRRCSLNVGNAISKCSKLRAGCCVQLLCQKRNMVELESWNCTFHVFKITFFV